ncbi:hypothetical protein F2Q69_00031710 [Brassica cretica]|uniref:Uncharacterized protein n=1 Tax=Brassica cretica TaxID=69181 RepID=A0A8S9RYM1_BRACR|nr:hypothetical protein F2Q69_00031710 [Brassica cretica]
MNRILQYSGVNHCKMAKVLGQCRLIFKQNNAERLAGVAPESRSRADFWCLRARGPERLWCVAPTGRSGSGATLVGRSERSLQGHLRLFGVTRTRATSWRRFRKVALRSGTQRLRDVAPGGCSHARLYDQNAHGRMDKIMEICKISDTRHTWKSCTLSLISISLDFFVSSVSQTLDWEADESFRSSSDMRRSQSASDFRASGGRGAPAKSKSSEDIYSRSQLEASAANKESFFAKRMAENKSKPEGLPPSQGGKSMWGLDQALVLLPGVIIRVVVVVVEMFSLSCLSVQIRCGANLKVDAFDSDQISLD